MMPSVRPSVGSTVYCGVRSRWKRLNVVPSCPSTQLPIHFFRHFRCRLHQLATKRTEKTNWRNVTPGSSGIGMRHVDWTTVVTLSTVSRHIDHASSMRSGRHSTINRLTFVNLASPQRHHRYAAIEPIRYNCRVICNVNVNVNVNNKFIEREGTKVSNALECRLQYWANRKVFNWRRKVSIESSGSRRYSGKLFQEVGPATANERGP